MTIRKAADFEALVTARDLGANAGADLTGYSVACQLRDRAGGALLASFTVDLAAGDSSQFSIALTDAETDTLPVGSAVLDFKLTEPGGDIRHSDTLAVTVAETVTD